MAGVSVRVGALCHAYPAPPSPVAVGANVGAVAGATPAALAAPRRGRGAEVVEPLLMVFHDAAFCLYDGEYASVTGPSGAGKSTLLAILAGLEPPLSGTVQVGPYDVTSLDGDALAEYRRLVVGVVFQSYALLDALSAQENVELALAFAGVRPAKRAQRARTLLDEVSLGARSGHLPGELSGGERQRVAVARALANDPALLLADEPTASLDEDAAHAVLDLLEQVRHDRGCTLVVATHNRAVAARAPVRLALVDGRVDRTATTPAGAAASRPRDVQVGIGVGAAAPGPQSWAEQVRQRLRAEGRRP